MVGVYNLKILKTKSLKYRDCGGGDSIIKIDTDVLQGSHGFYGVLYVMIDSAFQENKRLRSLVYK